MAQSRVYSAPAPAAALRQADRRPAGWALGACVPSRALFVCLTFPRTVLGVCGFILRPY